VELSAWGDVTAMATKRDAACGPLATLVDVRLSEDAIEDAEAADWGRRNPRLDADEELVSLAENSKRSGE
jgi:hypothetical protein